MTAHISAALLVAALMVAAGPVSAADNAESTVSGTGIAVIEKQPEILRMGTEVQVEAASLKDALAKMKTRREELKASLVKLGAVEMSIDLGETKVIDASGGDRRDAMSRMMRQRMAATKPGSPASAKTITVTTTIRADWALKPGDEALLAATELQEKIKGAKLTEAPKSPAKAEEEEEGAGDSSEGPKPGELSFYYVAKISEADQARGTAEAFAKSKDAASRLAKAAGATLGNLKTLSGQSVDGNMGDEYGYSRYSQQRALYQLSRQASETPGETEAYSAQFGKITHQTYVSATFSLK